MVDRRLTFYGVNRAKHGTEFVYVGVVEKCKPCQYFTQCHTNLEYQKTYHIVKLRDKVVHCPAFDEQLRLVEVIEPELKVNVDAKFAITGATMEFHKQVCAETHCEHYGECVPTTINNGRNCKILEVKKTFKCPVFGHQLTELLVSQV